EDWRVGEDEAARVEEVADGVDDLVAHAQDRLLARRTDPQMPAFEQVVGPVLLRRDRVVVRLRDDFELRDVQLEATRGTRVGAHTAVDDDRAFLGEVVRLAERLFANGLLRHDALDESASVPYGQEVDLSTRTAVVQPSAQRDGLAFVFRDVIDARNHELVSVRSKRCRARRASARTAAGPPVPA